jgi:hypothetical protein
MSALEVCQVTKVYGAGAAEVHALRGVDLSVPPGQMVARRAAPPQPASCVPSPPVAASCSPSEYWR